MLHNAPATAHNERRRGLADRLALGEGWQARAVATYRQQGASSLVEALRRAIRELAGEEAPADRIWVNEAERAAGAVVDGVHFRWEHDRLVLLRPCAHCGLGLLASPPLRTRADLGYALAAWEPRHPDCEPDDPADW
jgi:hypothetical protein